MARVENSLDVDLGSHLGCSVRGAASGFPAFSVLGIKRMGDTLKGGMVGSWEYMWRQ